MNEKGLKEQKKQSWWILFLKKRKKEKEEKKKQEEQIRLWQQQHYGKSYSKPQIFFLTILGFFLNLFSVKTKKSTIDIQKIDTAKKINQDILFLEEKAEMVKQIKRELKQTNKPQQIVEKKQVLEKVLLEVKPLKEKYKQVQIPKEEKVIPKNVVALEKVQQKIEEVNTLTRETLETSNQLLKQKKETLENTHLIKEMEQKQVRSGEIPLKENKQVKAIVEEETYKKIKKTVAETNDATLLEESLHQLEKMVQQTDSLEKKEKYEKEIRKIKDKKYKNIKKTIEETSDYITLEECLKQLEKMTEQTDSLEEKEKYLKEIKKIKAKVHPKENELMKTAVKTVLASTVIAEVIQKVEEKEEPKKQKEKPEKKKEEKKKEVQKQTKRTEEDLNEILLMETLIYNKIKEQKREIKHFKEKLNSLQQIEKKPYFLRKIMQYVNHAIRLTFSLFPFAIFKNKKIGFLTSAIMVNNNIRSMRNAVGNNQVPYIEFNKIANKIKKSEEELEHAKYICYDSLDQIIHLKNEFLSEMNYETSPEIEAVLKQMNTLESMIISRTKELGKTNEQLWQVKVSSKQKIKKMENGNWS